MGKITIQTCKYIVTLPISKFSISGSNKCTDGIVRLVNEREGRVEICYNGVWGIVCADNGWGEVDANVVCQQLSIMYQRALPTNDSRFGDEEGPVLLENVRCSEGHSTLSQCVNFWLIGVLHRCEHGTAGVICTNEFTSTEQVPTATFYVTTTNMSHNNTYKSHDATSNTSDNSVVATIVGTVGTLFIVTVIAFTAMVLIAVLRLRKTKQSGEHYRYTCDICLLNLMMLSHQPNTSE